MMVRELNGALFAKNSIFDLEHRKRQALEASGHYRQIRCWSLSLRSSIWMQDFAALN